MKGIMKWILCLVLIAALIQASSALTKSGEKVTPSGDLKVNDMVTVTLTISIPRNYAYDLEFSSMLTNGQFTPTRIGEQNTTFTMQSIPTRTGTWLISQWVLSDKNSYQIQITFKGAVVAPSTGNSILLLKITEKEGEIVVSEYPITRNVINPAEITSSITAAKTDAAKLLQSITTLSAQNVSTSVARSKYDEAINLLNQADAAKTSNFTKAQSLLSSAKTAITDGTKLLEKAVIQKDIDSVETVMNQVDAQITYFKVNRSISTTDPRLLGITSKYDAASTSLSMAKTSLNGGNNAMATTQAADAKIKAQDALNLSANLRKEMGEGGLALPGVNPTYILIGVGIVVIGAVGVLVYRKFFRWDELG